MLPRCGLDAAHGKALRSFVLPSCTPAVFPLAIAVDIMMLAKHVLVPIKVIRFPAKCPSSLSWSLAHRNCQIISD